MTEMTPKRTSTVEQILEALSDPIFPDPPAQVTNGDELRQLLAHVFGPNSSSVSVFDGLRAALMDSEERAARAEGEVQAIREGFDAMGAPCAPAAPPVEGETE